MNRPPEAFTDPLMDWIPRVTPRWEPPLHLKPLVDKLEIAPGAGLRIVASTPPQHGKTECAAHSVCWWLKKWPELRHAYATYAIERAARVSRNALGIATRGEVALKSASTTTWTTHEGGQVIWTSVGGSLTGEPIDGVMLIDDALKDRAHAESAGTRETQKDWYHGTVESRLHPGASVIVIMTRWHHEDLAGYLIKHQGFEYINLKAIADGDRPEGDDREPGQALWPAHRPLEMLQERQLANQWNFASLYQGQPQPRGTSLFRAPTYYSELPKEGFKVIYGADLSYSGKSHADFSVLVKLWVTAPKNDEDDITAYVVGVDRKQVDAPTFGNLVQARVEQEPGPVFWIASGTELGVASYMRKQGVQVIVRDPRGRDKLTRSLKTSELWNRGRIMVPVDQGAHPWVEDFVDELTAFTGVKDATDDQVDALVSAVEDAVKFGDLKIQFIAAEDRLI